jgi:hypothetical protein
MNAVRDLACLAVSPLRFQRAIPKNTQNPDLKPCEWFVRPQKRMMRFQKEGHHGSRYC